MVLPHLQVISLDCTSLIVHLPPMRLGSSFHLQHQPYHNRLSLELPCWFRIYQLLLSFQHLSLPSQHLLLVFPLECFHHQLSIPFQCLDFSSSPQYPYSLLLVSASHFYQTLCYTNLERLQNYKHQPILMSQNLNSERL